jgi:hypothetical protein
MDDDLRRYERIGAELPCRLFISEKGEKGLKFQAFTSSVNVGLGGVFVKSSFLLKKGVDVNVEIALPDRRLSARARVSHLMPPSPEETKPDAAPSGMGMEFVTVEEGREALLHYVAPPRYQRFFDTLAEEFPHIADKLRLRDVAFILNLWETWKTKAPGRPTAAASRAPAPPRHRSTARRPSR